MLDLVEINIFFFGLKFWFKNADKSTKGGEP